MSLEKLLAAAKAANWALVGPAKAHKAIADFVKAVEEPMGEPCPACEIGNTVPVLYTSTMWYGQVHCLEGNYCKTCGETHIESPQARRNQAKYDAVRDAAGVAPGTPSPHPTMGGVAEQMDRLHNVAANFLAAGNTDAANELNRAAFYLDLWIKQEELRAIAMPIDNHDTYKWLDEQVKNGHPTLYIHYLFLLNTLRAIRST